MEKLQKRIEEEIRLQFPTLKEEVLKGLGVEELEIKISNTNEVLEGIIELQHGQITAATVVNMYSNQFGFGIAKAELRFVFFNTDSMAKVINNLSLGNCGEEMIEEVVKYYINHELTHCKQYVSELHKFNNMFNTGVPQTEREADEYAMQKAKDKDIAMVLGNLNANCYRANYDLLKTIRSSLKITLREFVKKIFR